MRKKHFGIWVYIFAIVVTAAVFAGTTHFSNISVEDLAVTDDLTITDDASVGGDLSVTGTTTMTGNATAGGTLGVTGNTTLGGTLAVTGAQTFTGDTTCSGDLGVTGIATFADDVEAEGSIEVSDIFYETKLVYQTDFMEAANAFASTAIASNYWSLSVTNGGGAAVAAGVNGLMNLSTSTTASSDAAIAFTTANFDTDSGPIMETYVKTSNITNSKINVGWRVDGNDYLMFEFDTDDDAGNIYLVSNNNGGGEVATDTGVDLSASTYVKLRIEIDTDETFTAEINGNEVASGHAGTIRHLTTFKPYFFVNNKTIVEEDKVLSIDYVKIWQNR